MRYLIVNADDLGLTPGINRGISEAHSRGVVTSASLMVDESASEEAARLCAELPELSVGLHVKMTDEGARPVIDLGASASVRAEIERQLERFRTLAGREPAHLDSHHNVHFLTDAAPHFGDVARSLGVTLRGSGPIRYFHSFYGRWADETHLEQISVASLLVMFETELGEGVTELGCHPGYVDPALQSTYSFERETERRTLCDPSIRARLDELGVRLLNSTAARQVLASSHEGG